jgi:hypothetical protein
LCGALRDVGSGHREGVGVVKGFGMTGIIEMGVPGVVLRHIMVIGY